MEVDEGAFITTRASVGFHQIIVMPIMPFLGGFVIQTLFTAKAIQ